MSKITYFNLLALAVLTTSQAQGQITISKIVSHTEIQVESDDEKLEVGDKLPIYAKGTDHVTGYAEIRELRKSTAKATVLSHSREHLILPGDVLKKIDFTKGPDENTSFPGRSDLFISGKRNISARYKPLVYRGLGIGETAATLDQGEYLIDILGFYAYGITNELSISTLGIANFTGLPNLGVKYRFLNKEWTMLSTEFRIFYRTSQDLEATGRLFFDTASNSKVISYTDITLFISPADKSAQQAQNENFVFGSSIATGSGYVLDNWNRILIGPKYYFDTQAVGAYIGYMIIGDRMHFSINLQTANITNLKINSDGYIPYFYVFWRF